MIKYTYINIHIYAVFAGKILDERRDSDSTLLCSLQHKPQRADDQSRSVFNTAWEKIFLKKDCMP